MPSSALNDIKFVYKENLSYWSKLIEAFIFSSLIFILEVKKSAKFCRHSCVDSFCSRKTFFMKVSITLTAITQCTQRLKVYIPSFHTNCYKQDLKYCSLLLCQRSLFTQKCSDVLLEPNFLKRAKILGPKLKYLAIFWFQKYVT